MVTFSAHIIKCAEKNPNCFTCGKCIFQCKEFGDFQKHCKTHLNTDNHLKCPLCPFLSDSQADMMKHSCTKKSSSTNNTTKPDKVETSSDYDCHDCNFFCNSTEQFEKHMSACHSVVWHYSCFHCSYKVQSFSQFSSHLSLKHPEVLTADPNDQDEADNSKPNEIENIECLHCTFSSKSQISVHEHMKKEHNNEPEISECNKRQKKEFSLDDPSKQNIVKFPLDHDKPLPNDIVMKFACNVCSYRTVNNSNLIRHYKRSHMNSAFCLCKLCDFKTLSLVMIKKHMKNNHQSSSEWELSKNGAESKENLVTPASQYKCDKCSYQCNYPIALRNHKIVHTPKQFKCEYCPFQTRSLKFLKRHVECRHTKSTVQLNSSKIPVSISAGPSLADKKLPTVSMTFKFFKCDRCTFIARHQKNLEKHIKAHDAEYNYKCPHCLFINTCFKTFRMHMNKFHPKEQITLKRHPLERYKYQCSKCGYETNSSEKLKKHEIDHEEGRFYHCEICQYIAVSHIRLSKHIKLKHPQTLLKKCNHCNYTTNRTKNYKAHLQAHKVPNAHKCTHCYFISSSHRSFLNHMSSRHPEKSVPQEDKSDSELCGKEVSDSEESKRDVYKCDKCKFSSNRESVLAVHLKCHESPDCLECDHCYFLTTQKHSFDKHLLEKHSIKKVFYCQKCDFNTKRFDFYKNHTRAHESKYSYRCTGTCNYITIRYSSYLGHMKKEHPNEDVQREIKPGQCDNDVDYNQDLEDPSNENVTDDEVDESDDDNRLACGDCSFTTIFPKSMEVHKKAHKSDKAIKCELCDYITVSNSGYKTHIRTNHPESKLKSELYKCSKCDYVTGSGPMFKSHQRAHGSDNHYKCEYCPYITVFYHSICSHMLRHHPEENNDIVKLDAPEGYFKKEEKQYKYYCAYCSFKCMYYKLYCNHIEQLHPGAKNDYEMEHEKKRLSKESDKLYLCKICDFQTDIAYEMDDHLPSHAPDQHYICCLCKFRSIDKYSYEEHIVSNHQSSDSKLFNFELYYVCPCCDFQTQSLDTYNVHLVAHPLKEKVTVILKVPKNDNISLGSLQYSCDTCGYHAKNSKQLEHHVLAHESSQSYDCEHCKFTSVNRQSYRKHLKKIHNILLPFGKLLKDNDPKTGLEFSKSKGAKHDPYKCTDCGFETSSLSAYKNHMGAHLVPDPLKCPFNCLYITVRSRWANMKTHLTRAHPASNLSRDDFFGTKNVDEQSIESIDQSVLYNSPAIHQMTSTPYSSTPNKSSTFLPMDSFSSIPLMLSRDESFVVPLNKDDVIMEEIVPSEGTTGNEYVDLPSNDLENEDDEISF